MHYQASSSTEKGKRAIAHYMALESHISLPQQSPRKVSVVFIIIIIMEDISALL